MSCTNPWITTGTKKGQQAKSMKFDNVNIATKFLNENYNGGYTLPCRKCLSCKMDNAREWAVRATMEMKTNKDNNYFITLTYSNEHVPKNKNGLNTLKGEDITLWIKKLRKWLERHNEPKIKYICGSEYGSRTKRPHYHICIFNMKIHDLKETGEVNDMGDKYYTSEWLEKMWGKGRIMIGNVSYQSAGYVARYTFKKQSKIDYKELDIEEEKLRMSKGIGLEYFKNNYKEIYKRDEIIFKTNEKVITTNPPKYYDRQLNKTDPKKLARIIETRIVKAKITNENKVKNSGMTFKEILNTQRDKKLEISRELKRKLKNKKEE